MGFGGGFGEGGIDTGEDEFEVTDCVGLAGAEGAGMAGEVGDLDGEVEEEMTGEGMGRGSGVGFYDLVGRVRFGARQRKTLAYRGDESEGDRKIGNNGELRNRGNSRQGILTLLKTSNIAAHRALPPQITCSLICSPSANTAG